MRESLLIAQTLSAPRGPGSPGRWTQKPKADYRSGGSCPWTPASTILPRRRLEAHLWDLEPDRLRARGQQARQSKEGSDTEPTVPSSCGGWSRSFLIKLLSSQSVRRQTHHTGLVTGKSGLSPLLPVAVGLEGAWSWIGPLTRCQFSYVGD